MRNRLNMGRMSVVEEIPIHTRHMGVYVDSRTRWKGCAVSVVVRDEYLSKMGFIIFVGSEAFVKVCVVDCACSKCLT